MFWWYGRPAMRLISCITGIHSSFGWLTHNVGEFYAPSSGHRIHGDGIYFGNDRAVASRTHSSSWLKRSPSAPAGPHDMFQKVHPICRLMKGRRLQSPLKTRAVNTWHTKDVGPGLRCEAQTLQRSPFLRWAPLRAMACLHSSDGVFTWLMWSCHGLSPRQIGWFSPLRGGFDIPSSLLVDSQSEQSPALFSVWFVMRQNEN